MQLTINDVLGWTMMEKNSRQMPENFRGIIFDERNEFVEFI